MPSIWILTFSPPLTVNSEAGFGGPLFKSLGLHSPPYCTGMSSGLINLFIIIRNLNVNTAQIRTQHTTQQWDKQMKILNQTGVQR